MQGKKHAGAHGSVGAPPPKPWQGPVRDAHVNAAVAQEAVVKRQPGLVVLMLKGRLHCRALATQGHAQPRLGGLGDAGQQQGLALFHKPLGRVEGAVEIEGVRLRLRHVGQENVPQLCGLERGGKWAKKENKGRGGGRGFTWPSRPSLLVSLLQSYPPFCQILGINIPALPVICPTWRVSIMQKASESATSANLATASMATVLKRWCM